MRLYKRSIIIKILKMTWKGEMWMFLVSCVALIFGPNSLIRMSQGLNRMIAKIDE